MSAPTMQVRVLPVGPLGEPARRYVAEVGEDNGGPWVAFCDSPVAERTRKAAVNSLRERLERRLLLTLMALDALAAADGREGA